MLIEGIFQITLVTATFLTSLVAGLLFIFAIVVMPGIKRLNDGEFIRAFQVIDGVIQNNHPLFLLAWMGSVVTLIAATALGFWQLDILGRTLIIAVSKIMHLDMMLAVASFEADADDPYELPATGQPGGRASGTGSDVVEFE